MTCRHLNDSAYGDYCRVLNAPYPCGGIRLGCYDNRYFNATSGQVKKIRRTDSWRRSMGTHFSKKTDAHADHVNQEVAIIKEESRDERES